MSELEKDHVVEIKTELKEKRDEMHLTNQDVADLSGVPLNTVTNYFSSRSKSPSIYTVGPLCAALGVSLDRYFGIAPPAQSVNGPDDARRIIETQQERLAQLTEKLRIYRKVLNIFMVIIFALLAACAFIAFCNPLQLA